MDIITCPNCSTRVLPTANRECPACRACVDADTRPKNAQKIGKPSTNDERWLPWLQSGVCALLVALGCYTRPIEQWWNAGELEKGRVVAMERRKQFEREGVQTMAVCTQHGFTGETTRRGPTMRRTGWRSGSVEISRRESVTLTFFDNNGTERKIDHGIDSYSVSGATEVEAERNERIRIRPTTMADIVDPNAVCWDYYVGKTWIVEYLASDPSINHIIREVGQYPDESDRLAPLARAAIAKIDITNPTGDLRSRGRREDSIAPTFRATHFGPSFSIPDSEWAHKRKPLSLPQE